MGGEVKLLIDLNALLESAISHHQAGRFAEAEKLYHQLLQNQPEHSTALQLLGTIACQSGQYEPGIAYIQSALEIDPNYRDACFNLGNAMRECDRLDEAISLFQRAIALDPDSADAHKALGISLLLNGELEKGFAAYEWRWQSREFQKANFLPTFSQSRWDGSDLQGKTILLYPEQGAGDQIQFIRYAALVKQRGGEVVYACHPALVRLFGTVTSIDRLVAAGDDFPAFDVYTPLLSLPHLLGTTLEHIPARVPYLFSGQRSAVSGQLEGEEDESFKLSADGFKVGLVWASSSHNSANRSCSLKYFLQLLDMPNVNFFSLQKEVSDADAEILKESRNLRDFREHLSDFADTAALIDQLDLVITVDTAVAHLAGAMGKPVWVLIPFAPDWRWMLAREDSPWYPTMRLFRQQQPGDWEEVIASVAIALIARVIALGASALAQEELPINSPQELSEKRTDNVDVLLAEISSHQQAGRLAEAIADYERIIELRPDLVAAYNNLGVLHKEYGEIEAAIANYQKAIALKPDFAEAYNNLGHALNDRGDLTAAIASYQKAIAISPNYANIHKDLGMCLLLAGEIEWGFMQYEWRWQSDVFKLANPIPPFTQPLWDGSNLAGKTILLYPEQGFGDQIQFIRYASLVQQRGGRVIFPSCSPLARLFATVFGIDTLLSPGDTIPPFDVYLPLMSLPRVFGTTLASIPTGIPYLFGNRLEGGKAESHELNDDCLKVGLVWACNRRNETAQKRSCPLGMLQELLDIPNVKFYSLQKDTTVEDMTFLLDSSQRIVDLSDRLGDFADTAALIDQLDLMITIDTAVAHLAGAMGKSVWVLLPFAPDWRWMLSREDSPWYPTMRLFRQQKHGDWEGAIASLSNALRQKLGEIREITVNASREKREIVALVSLDALLQEAIAHHQAGRLEAAEQNYLQILDRQSEHFTALHMLGAIACQTGNFGLGITRIQAALKIDPMNVDAYFNLGNALWENGNLEEATLQYQKVLSLKPDRLDVRNHLGRILHQQGRLTEAIAYYQQAIALQPNNAEIRQNLSLSLLLAGNLERGFVEYEWRRTSPGSQLLPLSHTRSPWDGSDLKGKTILVYLEQGLGDHIQFIRYASLLKARGAKVIFTCPPELVRLLSSFTDVDSLPTTVEAIPNFDVWVPLLSLPHLLGTTLETIPKRIPYLFSGQLEGGKSEGPVLSADCFKVGLVWSSKSNFQTSLQRSCPLDLFLPLLEIPDIGFYSLQKEVSDADREIFRQQQAKGQNRLTDLHDYLHDFADTAAIIDQLDLVITIDTAVAHLAGAMGKLVWVLLPSAPDWRWMLEREDSAWYPTMRLFRQQHPGDWEEVIARVKTALKNG
jgi:tetratricopeptide (TPR) repeat protein